MQSLPRVAPGHSSLLGGFDYAVKCLLGEGGFARVYRATDRERASEAALKVQKPACPWEHYVLSKVRERLDSRRQLGLMVSLAHLSMLNEEALCVLTESVPDGDTKCVCISRRKRTRERFRTEWNVDCEFFIMTKSSLFCTGCG